MPIRYAIAAAALVAVLALPAGAPAARDPSRPPAICAGDLFSDQIGTAARDVLEAGSRPERLWGLGGRDLLIGAPNRASCLMGGTGADSLLLGDGGGVIIGEEGGDMIIGSGIDDVLLGAPGSDTIDGRAGIDSIDGGGGRDTVTGGDGNDSIVSEDGVAELIDCGEGSDRVVADRVDALVGCESSSVAGEAMRRATGPHAAPGPDGVVRVRFRTPAPGRAGAYRVILLDGPTGEGCLAPGSELTRLPVRGARVAAGRLVRVGLRPPPGGWCAGVSRAVVVRYGKCPRRTRCGVDPPPTPVVRLHFRA